MLSPSALPQAPQVRIINLETSVTSSTDADPHKSIHYKASLR